MPKKKKEKKKKKRRDYVCDYDGEYMELNQQLASYNLCLKQTAADGNCLFRSISDQLTGSEVDHMYYREKIVDYMEDNAELYAPFIDGDFNQYLRMMSKDSKWGGNLELAAASKCFSVTICIHQLNAPILTINGPESTSPIIHIAYLDQEHYSSIRDNKKRGNGLVQLNNLLVNKNISKDVKILIEKTGCKNIGLIERLLDEMSNDIDATCDALFALKSSNDAEFYKNNDDLKEDVGDEKKKKKKKKKVKDKKKLTKKEKKKEKHLARATRKSKSNKKRDDDSNNDDLDEEAAEALIQKLGAIQI